MDNSLGNCLSRARDLLAALTPLTTDCGQLCSGRCCEPGDEDTPLGMALFPGEEALLPENDFDLLEAANGETLAVCRGTCDRDTRPLSCRIFPLAFYISPEGKKSLIMDPRAKAVCPLCRSGIKGLDPEFRAAAREAMRILLQDETIAAFIRRQSREIDAFKADPFYRLTKDL